MQNPHLKDKIVFFDGVCVLCNRAVDFLLKKDSRKCMKFSSLQSEFAVSFLNRFQNCPDKEDSIIFYDKGQFLTKSTAVVKIAGYLRLPYSAFAIFIIIPRPWRDWVYDIIARNRAKWFGRREKCRVPDQETRGRIID